MSRNVEDLHTHKVGGVPTRWGLRLLTLHGLEGSIERKSAGRGKAGQAEPGGPGCDAGKRFDGGRDVGDDRDRSEKKKRKENSKLLGKKGGLRRRVSVKRELDGGEGSGRSTRVQRVYQSYLLVGMALRGIGRYLFQVQWHFCACKGL